MNKQIKELAEQAGYPDYMTYGQDLVLERFADLIVRECIDTVSDCSVEYCTRPQIVSEIKQHFGVDN
jgi:hypothetical protein